jgi:octaprenyl-diphosphate synthase
MDYTSTAEEMGKNVGDDLAEGKPTLPLIYTMRTAPTDAANRVRNAIETGGLEQLDAIISDVQACGAIEYTEKAAQAQAQLAIDALAPLDDSPYKVALIDLAKASVNRRN